MTAALLVMGAITAPAEQPLTAPTPPFRPAPPPPTQVQLTEKPWEALSNQQPSSEGLQALKIDAKKWKHAETPHFILHYRRVTEAQKVAREIEFTLWWVAAELRATPDRYARRSHVYIFEDAEEWKQFNATIGAPGWFGSFAKGDELFLNVRESTATGRFDFETLAHETTHAVVARLYPTQRWPLWMNEGFAEYAAGASIAARRGQSVRRHQTRLRAAEMPLDEMFAMSSYPATNEEVAQLYQSSEKFVRFLHNELAADRFAALIDAQLKGADTKSAVLAVYGDKIKDWETLLRRYERFTK